MPLPLGTETRIRYVRLSDALPHLGESDLAQWRGGRRAYQRVIRLLGRGRHRHSAKLSRWIDQAHCAESDWMLLESVEAGGIHAISLAQAVAESPGLIDIFQANATNEPDYCPYRATRWFRRQTGRAYGWRNLLRVALRKAIIGRLLFATPTDDALDGRYPPFCSQAVAMADREGGVDPVPNLADGFTEPADLSRSLFYKYRFTLLPD